MRRTGAFLFYGLILIGVAAAAPHVPVEVRTEADKQVVTTDDLLTCKIIITSSLRNIAAPKLPDFKGFTVVSQAQSSTVSLKAAAVNTILVFAFVLLPVETGTVAIGPATVTVEGTNYSSQPLTITVKQGSRRPAPAQQQDKPAVPQSDLPRYSL